ncbi:MAG: molybdopterin-binding protein [Candidatus Thermoplasmatota archaeon]|jgi:molybdenum cofactor biosynthesis protein B|nr:molybdopterin-binding protein [Candidatus Thermoplasmatota archaeon]MCL5785496.1 molybdopterin-binding protein [Candidatus Thermoplasmatota archaeon]
MTDHTVEKKIDIDTLVVTVSTSRTPDSDVSGSLMEDKMRQISGSTSRMLIRDSSEEIVKALEGATSDVIVFVGGTGPSRMDLTAVTLRSQCEKEIPGFGELFRRRSEDSVGLKAYLSDASMFIYDRKIIFAVPGSRGAQEMASEIISGILWHLLGEARKE